MATKATSQRKNKMQITINELGAEMQDRIKELKVTVKDFPVDGMEIKEYPFASLRINANTWVEVF
jgi:hypothetical protein